MSDQGISPRQSGFPCGFLGASVLIYSGHDSKANIALALVGSSKAKQATTVSAAGDILASFDLLRSLPLRVPEMLSRQSIVTAVYRVHVVVFCLCWWMDFLFQRFPFGGLIT
jgi:hypothetical protein